VDDHRHDRRYSRRAHAEAVVIRHFLNPPNWFTSASLLCSMLAMTSLVGVPASPDTLARAAVLIIFGGIFDMLDGRVARITGRHSEFGVQLDSLADFVGFGAAPALLAWAWCLHELGAVGVAAAFWYALATAFRLARFNVATAQTHWPFRGHSQGLTSTMGGGAFVTFCWVSNGWAAGWLNPPPAFVAAFLAGLGLLMVSSLPFRNFRDLRGNRTARRILAPCMAACLVGAFAFDVSLFWGIGAVLYLSVGLVDGLVVAAHHRWLDRALLPDEDWSAPIDDDDEDAAQHQPVGPA
jgi:CDP-diacylglycerol--serine O-phosphatidyltransferase